MVQYKTDDAQNKLCDRIVTDMRCLHERIRLDHRERVYELCELVTTPEGAQVIQTLQLLSGDKYASLGVYLYEGAKIVTESSQIFAHQLEMMSLHESAKIQNPELAPLIRLIDLVRREPQVDIHGTQFIQRGGKAISVKREKTETGETVGFSFERSADHNYHMCFYPEQRLTTAIGGKIIDEVVEEADIEFIRDKSKWLIDWAYKVLGY